MEVEIRKQPSGKQQLLHHFLTAYLSLFWLRQCYIPRSRPNRRPLHPTDRYTISLGSPSSVFSFCAVLYTYGRLYIYMYFFSFAKINLENGKVIKRFFFSHLIIFFSAFHNS